MSRVWIDIETLPADWDDHEKMRHARWSVPKNITKQATREKWIAENLDEAHRKTSLESTQGRILCVGWCLESEPDEVLVAVSDGTVASEDEMLGKLEKSLREHRPATIVAHNGVRFDFRWLRNRALLHGRYGLARRFFQSKPWDTHLADTYAAWVAPDRSGRGKLTDVCRFLGIEVLADEIDGSQVYDRWLAGDMGAIITHVHADVLALRDLDRVLCRGGLL